MSYPVIKKFRVRQTTRQQESTTFMICFLHLHLLSNCYHLTSSAVISDCSEEFKNGNRHEDEEGLWHVKSPRYWVNSCTHIYHIWCKVFKCAQFWRKLLWYPKYACLIRREKIKHLSSNASWISQTSFCSCSHNKPINFISGIWTNIHGLSILD